MAKKNRRDLYNEERCHQNCLGFIFKYTSSFSSSARLGELAPHRLSTAADKGSMVQPTLRNGFHGQLSNHDPLNSSAHRLYPLLLFSAQWHVDWQWRPNRVVSSRTVQERTDYWNCAWKDLVNNILIGIGIIFYFIVGVKCLLHNQLI